MKLTIVLLAYFINFIPSLSLNAEVINNILKEETEKIRKQESVIFQESKINQIHIVKEGDTLSSISKIYSIDKALIIELNNLKDKNYIYVGQNLRLSAPNLNEDNENNVGNKLTATYHIVQVGENLTEISNKYNLDLQYLIKINNLTNPDSIKLGSKLYLTQNSNQNRKKKINQVLKMKDIKTYGPIKVQKDVMENVGGRNILNVLNQKNKKLIISINCNHQKLDVRSPGRKWKGWRTAEEEFEKELINDFC